MKLKKLCYIATIASVACVVFNVSAQVPDAHWSGLGGDGLWGNPNNWTPVGVPPSDVFLCTNVWLDAANGWSSMTITNGEVESPGTVHNTHPPYGTIFGPEWGVTLNVSGTLNFDWLLFPVQNNPAAPRSYINVRGNGLISTTGAAIGIGDSWFFHEGCYVTMNLYDNAQYKSLGGAGLWLGGHLNIYDNATFLVNGYINMAGGVNGDPNQTDGTRVINVAGGTLKLPESWINGANTSYNGGSGTVTNFIARGILRAYGKGYNTNDFIITDDGTNTIVKAVPLGGALQRVYFKSLPKASVSAGGFQQASLVGDYPSVTSVVLSSSEPGADPTTFAAPVYSSSNPNVATVDANGTVTAVSPGTATITATVGVMTSTNTLLLTVTPVASLVHRYSFNEASGTTAADSVGGATWNATLVGTAAFNGTGQVVLDGATNDANYVSLPAGLVSNLDDVTIEAWASFGATTNNNFENLFAFGFTDTDPLSATYNLGGNYIIFQPRTGAGTAASSYGPTLPGNAAPANVVTTASLDGQANVQVVCVFSPSTGTEALYTNGVLVGTAPLFNNMVNPVALQGPLFNNGSILNRTLGTDPNNYIGHSLYGADPGLLGNVDEFRIYSGPLTAAQIAADKALGPNQLRGTSTSVSLAATQSGGNAVFSWSTNSALVTLVSSPVLGPGAVWTPVSPSSLVVVGANYQMTMPMSGARFFRLSQ